MNMRRLPFVMALTVSAWAVGCGDNQKVENPPQATTGPATMDTGPATTAAPATSSVAATTSSAPATSSETVAQPPPVRPAKEKIVAKWQVTWDGDVRQKHEDEAKKKFAKEKDSKKSDAFLQKFKDEVAGEWIEFTADSLVWHKTEKGKDKVAIETKYKINKSDDTTLSASPDGKPKTGKVDAKAEFAITFRDDSTIELKDPVSKETFVLTKK